MSDAQKAVRTGNFPGKNGYPNSEDASHMPCSIDAANIARAA